HRPGRRRTGQDGPGEGPEGRRIGPAAGEGEGRRGEGGAAAGGAAGGGPGGGRRPPPPEQPRQASPRGPPPCQRTAAPPPPADDGVAVSAAPKGNGFAANAGAPAVGDAVREGQRLMFIVDTGGKMHIRSKIPEAVVSSVRPGQKVRIRVDAFPAAVVTGSVR